MDLTRLTRRTFLMGSAGLLAACATKAQGPKRRTVSANEKLNIAAIGAGGKGAGDIKRCGEENNVVALCDVDDKQAEKTFLAFPDAKRFRDFRQMFDKMGKEIDAVTVSTPDHTHAVAAMCAMQLGKHVYVQKPLTHTIHEARMLTEAARKYKVITQMGNQGHSGDGAREVCEMIASGVIGGVRECHIWTNRPVWEQGLKRPTITDPVPATLDWDLWIGPAPMRPYVKTHPDTGKDCYCPWVWRGWWDFGCGALGDMGCHIMDAANWALKLCPPTSVEVVKQEGKSEEQGPKSSILRYEFPARAGMPPVTVFWHDGGNLPPRPAGVPAEDVLGDKNTNGTLFIGEKGFITAGEYGGNARLLPDAKMKDYQKPTPTIERIPEQNHYKNWTEACKSGKPSCSNFDYAGPFTEIVLLGNLALRTGKKIEWDAKNMKVTNAPEANQYVKIDYRKGWTL